MFKRHFKIFFKNTIFGSIVERQSCGSEQYKDESMQSVLYFWMKYFFESLSTCTAGRVPLDPVASLISDAVCKVSQTAEFSPSVARWRFTKTSLTAFMGKPSTNTLSCQTEVTTLSCWGFGMRDILVTMLVLTSLTWFKLTTCQSIFNVLLCFQSHAWTKYAIQLPHWRNVMYYLKIYCKIIYR